MATIYELADEAWENDVSGAWLQGRDDGEVIGIEKGKVIGIAEGEVIGIEKGEVIGIEKGKIEVTVNIIKELELPLSKAMSITRLPESARTRLTDELKRQNIIYRT